MADSKTQTQVATWEKFSNAFSQRNVESNAKQLIPYIKPNSRIIDVGCGLGSITIDLAQRVSDGFVLGIDISEDSIATAKAAAEKLSLKNVEFKVLSVDALSSLLNFYPTPFDIAHLHQVLLHLADPVSCLKSLRPLLNPTTGLISTRDSAHLHFHPSGPTMALNFTRVQAHSPGHVYGAGNINHVWMHEAGFKWEEIETGAEGMDTRDVERRRVGMDGYMSLARQRSEGEEFLERLRGEWQGYLDSEEGRVVWVDGWCLGRMGGA